MHTIYQLLSEIEKNNESAALCTVTNSQGSTPRHGGSKMLVYPDGRFIGTVGGGEVEQRVIHEALMALDDGVSRLLHYDMIDPARGDPGSCGGQVEIFVEPILPDPLIIVIGAGHVGKAVVHLAKWLGFRVAACDDRTEFCNAQSLPEADAYYPVTMSELPQQININKRTFLILTTRGSEVDAAGLPALLAHPAAYVGVIGSKRRWATTVKELKEKGITDAQIAKIHSPMGLELQAETPEEIAVSIMAEVIMVKEKGTGKAMNSEKQN
jgi:xanthine dehydrogenase accessory factor